MPPCHHYLWTDSGGFFYWELEKNGDSLAMKESDLNHDIVSLFKTTGSFAYKIPDPVQAQVLMASKRPFDGFARFQAPVNDFWFESKLMKNKIGAFSLDRVDDHQYESLLQIKKSGGLTAVIFGVWIPRQDYWFMCFDPEFLFGLAEQGKKSINKKELNYYCEKNYNISLRSKDLNKFSPGMMRDRIIDFLPDWEAGVGKIQG
jgi:penicillin-binding protein-related factor A (putative recombinase)